jgi:acetyltransferase-like isoleucine patch superfamily enzyme
MIKRRLRAIAQNSNAMAMLAAHAFVVVSAIAAARFRLRLVGRAHVAWSARVTGWRRVFLGKNVVIGAGSWLNVNDRLGAGTCLQICDNSFIGRNNFFTVGRSIIVREYCLTASNCAFIGSSHVSNPMLPYATTGTTDTDSIYIGANCFFGYGAVVMGDVRIGHGSIIGAGSVVRGHIPPFSIAVGNPARVVRRFDFSAGRWVKASEYQHSPQPDEAEYVLQLRGKLPFVVQPLSAATSFLGDI